MFTVEIITDQTDADGDTITHQVDAVTRHVDRFYSSLNDTQDYAAIIDSEGMRLDVRKMDIHAVRVTEAWA